jgi:hypothetical protein
VARNDFVARAMVAFAFVSLAGCSEGDRRDAKDDLLRQRLEGIEKRLGSLESRMGPVATVAARLGGLESRMAALEARPAPAPPSRENAPGAPSGGQGAPGAQWSPPASPAPGTQHDEVSALREEFQARLAKIQGDPADSGTPEAREQAIRDLSEWYTTRLRAVLGNAPWQPPR